MKRICLKKILARHEAQAAKAAESKQEEQEQLEREAFNRSLAEAIENYKKSNNIRSISYNQGKDDKYEIGGKLLTVVQQGGLFKVFEANKFIPLNDYLSKNFPNSTTIKKPNTNNNQNPTKKPITTNTTKFKK